jgi:hypothetical protein
MTSSSAVDREGCGCETSLFQLEGDISEEYVKKCISFHGFSLERRWKVLKSSGHGKKHRTGEAGGNLKDAVPTNQLPELNQGDQR